MKTTGALPLLMIASLSLASASPRLPLTLGASLLHGVRSIAGEGPRALHLVQRRATTGDSIDAESLSNLRGDDINTPTVRRSSSAQAAPVVARSSTVGPAADSALAQAALNAHNELRAQHGASPLVWDDSLASAAQDWADKCVFQHGGGESLGAGENLAALSGNTNTIDQGIKLWSDEAPNYDPSNPSGDHFTQMVWKSTTSIGCAMTSCDLEVFPPEYWPANLIVCEYLPPGNVSPASNYDANVQA